MSKKKSTTQQTQNTSQQSSGSSSGQYANQNFYGEYVPSSTADIEAFRGWKPQIDPGLSYQYGNARNNLRKSLISPTGGYRTAAMDDAIMRSGERSLNQDEAQAYRGATYDQNSLRAGQLGSLAALTRPSLVQTGSTGLSSGTSSGSQTGQMSGTGTVQQSGGLFGDLLGGAATIGSAALM